MNIYLNKSILIISKDVRNDILDRWLNVNKRAYLHNSKLSYDLLLYKYNSKSYDNLDYTILWYINDGIRSYSSYMLMGNNVYGSIEINNIIESPYSINSNFIEMKLDLDKYLPNNLIYNL
jgi:hypothetical protein